MPFVWPIVNDLLQRKVMMGNALIYKLTHPNISQRISHVDFRLGNYDAQRLCQLKAIGSTFCFIINVPHLSVYCTRSILHTHQPLIQFKKVIHL